ncbi:hypothetical protein SNEBB_006520 [Seison nebaliae]|nr:hypothetical protein SNEBB_006520 [Seison nebaliae]
MIGNKLNRGRLIVQRYPFFRSTSCARLSTSNNGNQGGNGNSSSSKMYMIGLGSFALTAGSVAAYMKLNDMTIDSLLPQKKDKSLLKQTVKPKLKEIVPIVDEIIEEEKIVEPQIIMEEDPIILPKISLDDRLIKVELEVDHIIISINIMDNLAQETKKIFDGLLSENLKVNIDESFYQKFTSSDNWILLGQKIEEIFEMEKMIKRLKVFPTMELKEIEKLFESDDIETKKEFIEKNIRRRFNSVLIKLDEQINHSVSFGEFGRILKQYEKDVSKRLSNYQKISDVIPSKNTMENYKNYSMVLSNQLIHLLKENEYLKKFTENLIQEEREKQKKIDLEETDSKWRDYVGKLKSKEVERDEVIEKKVKTKMECQLREELIRQSQIHRQQLNDTIERITSEMNEKNDENLSIQLKEQQFKFQRELAKAIGRIEGLEHALQQRSMDEKALLDFHQLTYEMKKLQRNLKKNNSINVEEFLKIFEKYYEDYPDIKTICQSLELAISSTDEILTEEILRTEWDNIYYKKLRSIALMKDDNWNLFQFIFSFFMSIFYWKVKSDISYEKNEIDFDDQIKMVDTIDKCIMMNEWEKALKIMNSLKGQPKLSSNSYRKQIRLMLTLKQATMIIHSYIDSLDEFTSIYQ